jgi:hypothetical protein
MACVVRHFEEARQDHVGRDDQALQAVATNLPTYLSQEIENPVVDGRLDEGWDDGDQPCRAEFVSQAKALQYALDRAMAQPRASEASAQLREIFGIHFPQEVSLIAEEKAHVEFKSAAAAASAAVIGISASEQMARAQSAAVGLRSQGLASEPWGLASDD